MASSGVSVGVVFDVDLTRFFARAWAAGAAVVFRGAAGAEVTAGVDAAFVRFKVVEKMLMGLAGAELLPLRFLGDML